MVVDRPEIAARLLRVLAPRLRRTDDDLADLTFTDVGSRVANKLLGLAQRFGDQENYATGLTHNVTPEELNQRPPEWSYKTVVPPNYFASLLASSSPSVLRR